jgi:YNFM family putative membrane transporter
LADSASDGNRGAAAVHREPSSRQRLAAVVVAGFSAFLGLHAPQPLLPLLQETFHTSTSQVSLLISIATTGIAVAAPLVGLVTDRFGRRRVILPAALFLALPSSLAATSGSFGQLLFWRAFQGLFTPAVSATTVAYITEEWEGGAAAAMSAFVAGSVLGGYTGRTAAAFLAARLSWRASFLALGILNLIGAGVIWAWLPAERRRRAAQTDSNSNAATIAGHLKNPALLAANAVGFCVLFSILAAFTYINFRLVAAPYRWSTASLGLLFTVYLVAAPVTMIAGRWIERLGYRGAAIGALAVSTSGILLTLLQSVPAIIAGLTVFCCGAFVAQSAANTYTGIAARTGRAAAVGLYMTSYYLGGSFGAAVPGYVWNAWGWPSCVAFVVAVQAITALSVARSWRERVKTKHHATSAIE